MLRYLLSRPLGAFLFSAVIAAPLVFGLALTKGLSHDEHQHVAAGALLAHEGLLPYVDYPHFHTPYLAFVYGLIFRATDHLLLGARLFSAACAAAIVGVMGMIAAQALRERDSRVRHAGVLGAVLLCLSSAVFARTTGKAWNQEPALLCALLAFIALLAALPEARRVRMAVAGLLLGLAIGFRITYAPLVAPFALAIFLAPATRERWLSSFLCLATGLAVALAGVGWFFAVAPEQTFFGNFEFAQVNVTYRFATGDPRTMTILKKLRYVWKEIIRTDAGLALAFFVPISAAFMAARASAARLSVELRVLLWTLPFLLIGSLAPSPMFEQYFYPFVPWLILGAIFALAAIPARSPWFRRGAWGAAAAVLLSLGMGVRWFRDFDDVFRPAKWAPIEIHAKSEPMRGQAGRGRVLTLAPLFPLEAGCRIYPAFATGPFAWRIAPFMDAAKAARLKMVVPATLPQLLDADPPAAMLTGHEERGEELLSDYAAKHGYRRLAGPGDEELWVRP